MNKRCDRNGFTTVELVIVIAVIATLATVLIPTFSNLVDKANESAALQEANSILKSYFIDNADDTTTARNFYIRAKGYYFRVIDGQLQKDGDTTAPTEGNAVIVSSAPTEPYCKTETITEPTEAPTDTEIEQPTTPENIGDAPQHDYPCYDEIDIDNYCDVCGKHVHKEGPNIDGYCAFCNQPMDN